VSVDRYAGAARRWAQGATIVYRPIADHLLATSPHPLAGRVVLDAGAGTGVASTALTDLGARAVAVDLSVDMLAWDIRRRPPAAVADVTRLPLRDGSVDDTVAAFVYNHLTQPELALAEAARVTRRGGALLACVYANASRRAVRDAIDRAARTEGWHTPDWYIEIKQQATPLLGAAEDMARVAKRAGLGDVHADERPVDVGVTEAEQLVDTGSARPISPAGSTPSTPNAPRRFVTGGSRRSGRSWSRTGRSWSSSPLSSPDPPGSEVPGGSGCKPAAIPDPHYEPQTTTTNGGSHG
jgi:ubiquinone/menaquinone biosynthesis C-methylase UbiE